MMVMMAFFWRLAVLSLKQEMTYRTAMVAGLATNLFFGLMRAMVLIALYNGRTEVNGLTLEAAITFVGLSQALIIFLRVFGSYDLLQTVYSGAIGADLLKPISLFHYWLAKDFGRAVFNLFTRGILFLLLFSLFYRILMPHPFVNGAFFLLALWISWLTTFAWRFMVNLSALWTPDARGVARMAFGLSQFLSGFILPLRLMPDWFYRFCYLTPFPSMLNTPVEIYLGTLSGREAVLAIAAQFAWFVSLSAISLLIMRAGLRRLVIQGG
jgi:ABC-2 type transport system permease protein